MIDDPTAAILDDSWWPPDAVDATALERKPKVCRRHQWQWTEWAGDQSRVLEMIEWCRRCHRRKDIARVRRGKTSRNRGNAYEREVAAKLGGRRVGQYGDKVDVEVPGYMRVQCKNGTAYPARIDGWLRAIPVQADLLRAVVIGDAPGPGGRRRSLIVMDLDEFSSWHGRTE